MAARDLEAIVAAIRDRGFDREGARHALGGLRTAIDRDLAAPPPEWARPPAGVERPTILICDDDAREQQPLADGLRADGYRVVASTAGVEAVLTAKTERPAVILLHAPETAEDRRRDLIGGYDRRHMIVCLPGITAESAATRLTATIEALTRAGIGDVRAGVAASTAPGAPLDELLGSADHALGDAIRSNRLVSVATRREA